MPAQKIYSLDSEHCICKPQYVSKCTHTHTRTHIHTHTHAHAHTHRCTELPSPPFQTPSDRLVQGLCQGVKLDVYFPGFPTLKHVDHDARLEKRGVRVFQAASRGENVILTLLPRQDLSKVSIN